ncbi:MAG: hypothetical protein E5V89_18965 [Mesorhizobium sp.]|uniref:hypothetical protein n=1 Tax=Mesorhizobium sp. TaxID=1871066 RepID=UPI000FE7DC38|nr:hypothetical protein [Mesorhizobium sp.]RWD59739.1 MAG: hypothetical protein EOS36_23850 [Mesorhizobium sp.]RWE38899.1 MAG: hypothetical protein EOS79_22205 [Mesorhizobium sp.]TIV69394.1 MAG: hypothetical protein E5V89_18965 [Mesorhizobium sp.]
MSQQSGSNILDQGGIGALSSIALDVQLNSAADGSSEQFQERCETVRLGDFAVAFRSELRETKETERFGISMKR